MSTVLTNGIIIPDNGSRNWGGDLANNWNIIDVNVGYMTDVKNRVTTLENSVAENSSNIQINTSNISALQTSKQDTIEDLETIRSGASAGATAVQPSALNNYVDLSSGQTIGGSKTFSNIMLLKSSRIERGSLPPTNITEDRELQINDKNNRGILGIFNYYYTNGNSRTSFYAYNLNTTDYDNIAIAFNFDNTTNNKQKSLMPVATNAVNLGTSTNKWKTLNGIDPGALSLASDTSIAIDTTSFEWEKNFTFTPSVNGYLFISFGRSDGTRLLSVKTGRGEYYITNQKGFVRQTTPVYKDQLVTILASSSITESVMPAINLFPCQGNV